MGQEKNKGAASKAAPGQGAPGSSWRPHSTGNPFGVLFSVGGLPLEASSSSSSSLGEEKRVRGRMEGGSFFLTKWLMGKACASPFLAPTPNSSGASEWFVSMPTSWSPSSQPSGDHLTASTRCFPCKIEAYNPLSTCWGFKWSKAGISLGRWDTWRSFPLYYFVCFCVVWLFREEYLLILYLAYTGDILSVCKNKNYSTSLITPFLLPSSEPLHSGHCPSVPVQVQNPEMTHDFPLLESLTVVPGPIHSCWDMWVYRKFSWLFCCFLRSPKYIHWSPNTPDIKLVPRGAAFSVAGYVLLSPGALYPDTPDLLSSLLGHFHSKTGHK